MFSQKKKINSEKDAVWNLVGSNSPEEIKRVNFEKQKKFGLIT